MAYFAKLDDNNIVTDVRVLDNEIIIKDGIESEQKGIDILTERTGHTNWKQTSYNRSFRGTFACVGSVYAEELSVFIPEKPMPSFILTPDYHWIPPVPVPDDVATEENPDGNEYYWDEPTARWKVIEEVSDDTDNELTAPQIQEFETGKAIPQEVLNKRQEARDAIQE